MKNRAELPIPPPFAENKERIFAVALIVLIVSFVFLGPFLGAERQKFLSRAPSSEMSSRYIHQQLYIEKSEIDLLVIGACTAWWQFYPLGFKSYVREVHGKELNVVLIGYNHFGSDLTYLALSDLLQRRKIKHLLLPLPKVEDITNFPHANAKSWWVYPQDLNGIEGLSLLSHIRLLGLSIFSTVPRWLASQQPVRNSSELAKENVEHGFNLARLTENHDQNYIDAQTNTVPAVISGLKEMRGSAKVELHSDWLLFYEAISKLAKAHSLPVTFFDSPHAVDFDPAVSSSSTIAWGFEKHFEDSRVIKIPFPAWQEQYLSPLKSNLIVGANLTELGAKLFTRAISPAIFTEISRHEKN